MTEVAEQENDPQVGNTTEEDDDDSAKEKETFQWNTPADEFAEDVASDVEEESEDEAIADANRDNSTGEIIELSHQSEIINGQIGLGEPEEKPKRQNLSINFPVQNVIKFGIGLGNFVVIWSCILKRKSVKMLRHTSAKSAVVDFNGNEI